MEVSLMPPRSSYTWSCIFLLGFIGFVLPVMGAACQESQSPPSDGAGVSVTETELNDPRGLIVGTWRLLRVERYDHTGARLSAPAPGTFGAGEPLGYLMYDGFHMGGIIQQEGRVTYPVNQRTPDDALAAVSGYWSYFGTYSVNETENYVTHRVVGSLNPRRVGAEYQRYYELSNDQLTLLPPLSCPDSFVTDSGCGYGTTGIQLRVVWEKLPPQPAATSDDRRFFGFWAIDALKRETLEGESTVTGEFAEGYLAYMPSGYMAVQLMRPGRSSYEGMRPTAGEADAAMGTYVSYAGPFTVQADEGYVRHYRAANLEPNGIGVDAQRFYEFQDGQLILMPPSRTVAGHQIQSYIHWNRISTLEE